MSNFPELTPTTFRDRLDTETVPTFLAFDADGDSEALRPAIPITSTVFWLNVPSLPINLGPFDMWEETPQ